MRSFCAAKSESKRNEVVLAARVVAAREMMTGISDDGDENVKANEMLRESEPSLNNLCYENITIKSNNIINNVNIVS